MDDNSGFNLGKLLGNARDMQDKLEEMHKTVSDLRATGESGGGMVKAIVNGNRRVVKILISDDAMTDRDLLQDLVAAAVSDAMGKIEQAIGAKMKSTLAGGMGMGGLL